MPTCSTFIEPLNLQCLLVNTFAGSGEIFLMIGYLFIASMSAFFRFSGLIFALFSILFTVLMSVYFNTQGFLILAVLIAGIVFYYTISKIVKN